MRCFANTSCSTTSPAVAQAAVDAGTTNPQLVARRWRMSATSPSLALHDLMLTTCTSHGSRFYTHAARQVNGMCVCVCVRACVRVCVCVCVWLSLSLSVCLSLSVSVCLPVCLSVCLPVCLSVCLPVCLWAKSVKLAKIKPQRLWNNSTSKECISTCRRLKV